MDALAAESLAPARLPVVESPALAALPGIAHAFFTREGGVSSGIYRGLNGGLGSNDEPEAVLENRRRMTAHLGLGEEAVVVVDPHGPVAQCRGDAQRPRAVIRPDAGGEAERCVVGLGDRLFFGVEGFDRDKGPKNLLLAEGSVGVGMGDQRRRQERGFAGANALAAQQHLVAGVESLVDPPLYGVARAAVDQRSHLIAAVEARPDDRIGERVA